MKLKLRVQRHLVVAWKAEDDGEWIFTLCRDGFGKLIGQKLRPGEEWLVEVNGKALEKLEMPKHDNHGRDKKGSWSLRYEVNKKGKGNRKVKQVLDIDGDKIGISLYSDTPDMTEEQFEGIRSLLEKHLGGIDDLNADDPKSHAIALRACGEYCNELADLMDV